MERRMTGWMMRVAVTVTDERSTAGVANLHAKVTAEKLVPVADALK